MKCLIITGSRNPEGQTAGAAASLLKGLRSAGGDGENVFLPSKNIERCRQCDMNGWGLCRSEGKCVIEDDFPPLVDSIRRADTLVFATPVYFYDISESMHAFLSRLRRICRNENGKEGIGGKPAVGICVAGGSGAGATECALSLEKMLDWCGFNTVDMVPVRRQNLNIKRLSLENIGQWLINSRPD